MRIDIFVGVVIVIFVICVIIIIVVSFWFVDGIEVYDVNVRIFS